MEDMEIIELYFKRNQNAISETKTKYGAFCHSVALNILSVKGDAEECVNDTYLQAWNTIPPQRPDRLGAWLGRVVRNISLNLWNKNHRKKRYSGMEQLMSELEDCIPSPETVEREIDEKELTEVINSWLSSLSKEDRTLFMRRYWKGEKVNELAAEYNISSGKLAKRMYNLRLSLKSALEREGYSI